MITAVTERRLVDIEFEDVSYSVKTGYKSGKKAILSSISGKFYSGELTAILGPSGSGKTTLLNVLAGYMSKGVTGCMKINSKAQDAKAFRKLSAYIMQDVLVQPLLTVQEAMTISARLKIGNNISYKEKLLIVDEILTVLGLNNACDTMSDKLSGGERKRLSLALELVSNPPVIFLDEPTSGLDSVATTQCLETLKVLTGQGRTIICSIHQPSASCFMKFDQKCPNFKNNELSPTFRIG